MVIPPLAASGSGTGRFADRQPDLGAVGQKVASTVLVGNWAGSAMVAAIAVGVSGALATAVGLVGKPGDFGLWNTFTLIASLMASVFGADLRAGSGVDGIDGGLSVGAFPLTLTVATLAATMYAFRRITARYTSAAAALADAVRSAVIAGVVVTVIALVFRSGSSDLDKGIVRVLGFDPSSNKDFFTVGASAVGAFFMTTFVIAAALAITVFLRRDWLPERVARVHDWLAAPLHGLAALVVTLPIAGAIAVAVVLLFGDSSDTGGLSLDEWMTAVAVFVAYLGNFGLALVSLGAAGKLGAGADTTVDFLGENQTDNSDVAHALTWFAGNGGNEPGLWVAVVVTPLWLAFGAYVVARRAGYFGRRSTPRADAPTGAGPSTVARSMAVWVATLLVAVPVLCRVASVHTSLDLSGDLSNLVGSGPFGSDFGGLDDGSMTVSMFAGVVGLNATLLLTLYGALVAFVVALLLGVVNLRELQTSARALARSAQTQPGKTDGQAGGQAPAAPSLPPPPSAPPHEQPPAQ